MPNASKLMLLMDLHPEQLTFALSDHASDPRFEITDVYKTEMFRGEVKPMAKAISQFLKSNKLKSRNISAFLSVPAPVISQNIEIPALMGWSFNSIDLKQALNLGGLTVINDMTACTLSLPEILMAGKYERIGEARPRSRDFPILMLAFRPDIGAAALVPSPSGERNKEGEAIWLPISAEVGPFELSSFAEHVDLIDNIQRTYRPLLTAQDVLSEGGMKAIYRAASRDPDAEPPSLAQMCSAADGTASKTTVELWSRFLGSLARNLALAYGARGGVYIFGRTARQLLNKDCDRNQNILRTQFELNGPTRSYLKDIPIYLVTHENPVLQGLSRLRP